MALWYLLKFFSCAKTLLFSICSVELVGYLSIFTEFLARIKKHQEVLEYHRCMHWYSACRNDLIGFFEIGRDTYKPCIWRNASEKIQNSTYTVIFDKKLRGS